MTTVTDVNSKTTIMLDTSCLQAAFLTGPATADRNGVRTAETVFNYFARWDDKQH